MRLVQSAVLREIRGRMLLLIFDEEGTKAMEVNESFSFLWDTVRDKEFEAEDLAAALIKEYDLEPDIALKEAEGVIRLWREKCLIKE